VGLHPPRDALKKLGLDVGRSTIQRILKAHGIEPAPLRGKTMPWKTFLKAHWGAIAAADFFSVEVLTRGGLVWYLVLFVIDLKTRRVHLAGSPAVPTVLGWRRSPETSPMPPPGLSLAFDT
jgi:hypothetical protein